MGKRSQKYILVVTLEVKWSEIAQSCPTLCDLMDYSLPGSSVHGILQAIVLEWIAIPFSRGSSWPGDWTQVSHIVDRRFTIWATREVLVRAWWGVIVTATLENLSISIHYSQICTHFVIHNFTQRYTARKHAYVCTSKDRYICQKTRNTS